MDQRLEHANATAMTATLIGARESAQRALFTAATRVLRHHAARLDARIGRGGQGQQAYLADRADGGQVRSSNMASA